MEANREKILEAKAKEGRSVMEQLHHTNHKPTDSAVLQCPGSISDMNCFTQKMKHSTF